jgi:phosphoserine phosphatase
MEAVIVDLCGTLILENTTRSFLRHLSKKGICSSLADLALSRVVSRISCFTPFDLTRRLLIMSLKGISKNVLYEEAREYVDDALRSHLNLEVESMMLGLRADGAKVFLATSSLDPIASALDSRFGFTQVVSSQLEYRDEICSGKFSLDATGQKWKLLTQQYPKLHQASIITVFTDNEEDTDLRTAATSFHWVGR